MTPGPGIWGSGYDSSIRSVHHGFSPPLNYPSDQQLHAPEPPIARSVAPSPSFGNPTTPGALEVAAVNDDGIPGCHVLYPNSDFELKFVPTGSGGGEEVPSASPEPREVAATLRPKKKRHRKTPDQQEREKIKNKRQTGVCLRCKMFKEKVGRSASRLIRRMLIKMIVPWSRSL